MGTLIWLVLLLGVLLTLAYRRTDLAHVDDRARRTARRLLAVRRRRLPLEHCCCSCLFVLLALLNVESIRRDNVTRRLFGIYRRMLPSMSKTEQEALEAGSVWWDGELFTGMPDWRRLEEPAAAEADARGASVPRRPDRRALPPARRLADHARARRHAAERVAVHQGAEASSR